MRLSFACSPLVFADSVVVTFCLNALRMDLNVKLEQQEKDMEQQKRKHETFQALSDKHVSVLCVMSRTDSCA